MYAFLLLLSMITMAIGLFAIGFGLSPYEGSLGNALVMAGSVALVGGMILFGLAAAVRQLREAGLNVGVSASPLLPGINDGELEAVAQAARDAGAQWFYSGVLFLMPSSAKQFLPFIREKFPKLAKQYEQWYAKNGYAPEEYRKKISERVRMIKTKCGFASRSWEGMRVASTGPRQMKLGWDAGAISEELKFGPMAKAS